MAFWTVGHQRSGTWKEASLKHSSRMFNTFNICPLHTLWVSHLYTPASFSPRITPAALLVIETMRNIDEYQGHTTIILKFIYRRIFAYTSCKSTLNMYVCGADALSHRAGPLQCVCVCVCVCVQWGSRAVHIGEEWHRRFYVSSC